MFDFEYHLKNLPDKPGGNLCFKVSYAEFILKFLICHLSLLIDFGGD